MPIMMTPREALQIQQRQIMHYADLYPGKLSALEAEMEKRTNLDGFDLDKKYDIFTINKAIPRGGDIESLVFGKVQSGD